VNRAALAAGFAIFVAMIYYLGPAEVFRVLKGTDPLYLAATLPVFLLSNFLRLHKWRLMRDRMGSSLEFGRLTGAYFSSRFWGMVSPMRSGEALPALLNQEHRGGLLSIVLYDRVIETFQTLIVFGGMFFMFYGVFFKAGAGIGLVGILAVLAAVVFVIFRKDAGEFLFSLADRVLGMLGGSRPVNALKRIMDVLRNDMEVFYAATSRYFSIGFTSWLLFLTFVCWGLDVTQWVVIFRALGMDVSIGVAVAVVVITSMVAALAPIPGGLGMADLSFVLVLGHFGYTVEAGGAIILVRLLGSSYVFLCYLIFGMQADSLARVDR